MGNKKVQEYDVSQEDKAEEEAKPKRLRKRRRGSFKRRAIGLVIVAVLVAVAGYGLRTHYFNQTHYLTSSQLTKIVQVSKLSAADYPYTGIAYKNPSDDYKHFDYAICYEATVPASADMSKIRFEVDDSSRTVNVTLPDITIGDPSIDVDSLDYLPDNSKANPSDYIKLCKEDARTEAQDAGGITQTARENLKSIVQALTLPLLEENGYTLKWDEDDANESREEGGNDEQ